ncbi:MAG: 2-succinyl-5-enolpyruvyl-6-hydroxy-3-cyclohexene-1-carboxylate synthase, partial [Chloroflexi bacterium]|nr:2-succinyl-5-enolpyruvyl-6-hydroxy-3-cyclohexene-1-carboxylate synthase [Chloroflexota bacterium]
TIDQIKIYGDQVLWSVDAALPEQNPPTVALRNLQTLAARAYATANGLTKGPVHINFPFRKPLQPASGANSQFIIHNSQFTIQHGRLHPAESQLEQLTTIIAQNLRGLIVCGPRCPGDDFPQAVTTLAKQAGYPILADPLSGVRFNRKGAENAEGKDLIVGGYETFLQGDPDWEEPEVIIRFGVVPLSKWLNAYLERINPAHRIHIRENGVWADDGQRTNWFLQANGAVTCQELTRRLLERTNRDWETAVLATETAVQHKLATAMRNVYFDGAIVADVVENLPDDSVLFMGNSLPVRHLDQFGRPSAKNIHVFANRGASGIDGNLSTALGLAAATGKEVTAVLGDITFYHDMNGLLPITNYQLPITIVLINNNGGGIFRRLPISRHEPPFTDLFLTPHGLDFAHAARLYGLDFTRVTDREIFREVFNRPHSSPRIIEVVTDGRADREMQLEIRKITNCE